MKTDTGRTTEATDKTLEIKREELESLKRRLYRLERLAANLRVEIGSIGRMYSAVVDPKLKEKAELERQLRGFRATAEEAADRECDCHSGARFEYHADPADTIKPPFAREAAGGAGESFKELYRRVAKAIHPDLSTNEEEKRWRQRLMAEANSAYSKKDRNGLRAILRQWESGPQFRGVDRSAELAVLIRDISWVLDRIRTVEAEIESLKKSSLYRLLMEIEKASAEGLDLLDEMVRNIDQEIRSLRSRLNPSQSPSAESQPDDSTRTVTFPSDSSAGRLFIRKTASDSFLAWDDFREAWGPVNIPAVSDLRLDIDCQKHKVLTFLSTLGEDDLQALFLYASSDSALLQVERLTGLKELYLSGRKITDQGLQSLESLKNLHRIYLYDTSVTEVGAESLALLPELRCITFCGPGVGEEMHKRLKSRLPQCRIIILNRKQEKPVKVSGA